MAHTIKPEEHELREARQVVEGALAACEAVLDKKEDLNISLGWDDSEFIEEVDGATGRCHSASEIEIYFNSGLQAWKDSLESSTAHEFAHAWFHEQKDTTAEDLMFVWQQVLMDAHAQIFADRITDYRDPVREVDEHKIRENWDDIREEMGKEFGEAEDIFYGNGEYPRWIGYPIAYRIGQKLLEKHELEDFPDLKRSDVLEAGDELFG